MVRAERDALHQAGHDVRLFSRHSDSAMAQPLYRLRSAGRVISGHGDHPGREIVAFDPEVVHVHNLFPNFARAWLRSLHVPFVHTMHNYRPFCASSQHFRDGQICHLCTEQGAWNAVRFRCYRGSAVASVPPAIRTGLKIHRDPVFTHAARVITLSDQMRTELMEAGLPSSRIVQWPNFLPDALDPLTMDSRLPPRASREGYLFVGRLDHVKGIVELLAHWPQGHKLFVVGNGPIEEVVADASAANPDVHLLGRLPRHEVISLMLRSRALVFPSRWYEGFPVVYPEALSCGLPVLATDPSSVAMQVEADGTGCRFPDVGSLTDAVATRSLDLPDAAQVRAVFDALYSQNQYLARATDLYEQVIAESPEGA